MFANIILAIVWIILAAMILRLVAFEGICIYDSTKSQNDERRVALLYDFPFRKYIRKWVPKSWLVNSYYFTDYDILDYGLTSNPNIVWKPLNLTNKYIARRFKKEEVNIFYFETTLNKNFSVGHFQVYHIDGKKYIFASNGITELKPNFTVQLSLAEYEWEPVT